jgi:hypothetical protein
MKDECTIVEVNGVKLEVDVRTARRIEEFRIGSRVKLRVNVDHIGQRVYPGIVIGFEPSEDLPTILVAYVEDDRTFADLKIVGVN